MRKVISLYQRNYDGDRLVRDEVVPGAEWVLAGEGRATRKYDGTCCLVRDGQLFKRHEVKKGKTPPPGFEPATEIDPETGKQQGWVAVSDTDPSDRWHREAFERSMSWEPGTYELVGPKVQGNPEGFPEHVLVPHGVEVLTMVPLSFEGIAGYLFGADIEGIVWHHNDGRMVKIKAKDFGIKRGAVPIGGTDE